MVELQLRHQKPSRHSWALGEPRLGWLRRVTPCTFCGGLDWYKYTESKTPVRVCMITEEAHTFIYSQPILVIASDHSEFCQLHVLSGQYDGSPEEWNWPRTTQDTVFQAERRYRGGCDTRLVHFHTISRSRPEPPLRAGQEGGGSLDRKVCSRSSCSLEYKSLPWRNATTGRWDMMKGLHTGTPAPTSLTWCLGGFPVAMPKPSVLWWTGNTG